MIPSAPWANLSQTRGEFGAAVTFWWFGQNLVDIAPYIADARAGVMPLLGGNTGQTSPYGFHDWEFILGEIGMSRYDQALVGIASHWTGAIIMLVACAWGGVADVETVVGGGGLGVRGGIHKRTVWEKRMESLSRCGIPPT